jgi:hypothetical protein
MMAEICAVAGRRNGSENSAAGDKDRCGPGAARIVQLVAGGLNDQSALSISLQQHMITQRLQSTVINGLA